jgi:hypothetical protein
MQITTMNIFKKFIFLIIVAIFMVSQTGIVMAADFYEDNPDFNQNLIITDLDMLDSNAMTISEIQNFINAQNGALATYIDPATNQSAFWTIWSISQEYAINPKFLMVLIQKEQSLMTDPAPDQSQYDWAAGFSCYGGSCMEQYRGFTMQLRSAANKYVNNYIKQLNETNCTFTNWCIGEPKMTQDEILVTPQNRATAALYTYNPYRGGTYVDGNKVGANYNFWKIWHNWFGSKSYYPDGSLLKADSEDTVYLIQNKIKKPFANWTSFITRFNPSAIITVSASHLDNYALGDPIKYPQYSILKDPQGNNYLMVNDQKRKIYDQETFRVLGFNPEEAILVSQDEINLIPDGEMITIASSYPMGGVLQSNYNKALFFVQNGKKYSIVNQEIVAINFPEYKIKKVSVDELEKYPVGGPVLLKDGVIVKTKTDDKVYIISNGMKLPIASALAFDSFGYDWSKIITISEATLNLHPTGETLDVIF